MRKIIVKNFDACVHCGSCEDACSQAFYKEAFRGYSCIRVSEDKIDTCTQCGLCAKVCPLECIQPNKFGIYMIDKNVCMGCCACVDICVEDVMVKSLDMSYASKCTACGMCVRACPMDVLELYKD